ncbi:MAG TPA: EAL domain-containing protein [Xanthobacteraceae bacterium]|nr:EAL domain-containing protein [Xanthobacteraceae bacterium]
MRPSVVVPIGVIVAVAIVCVVVAALSSAQRADGVALDNERQLFTRALTNQGERVLRDISAVATSEAAYRRIRTNFDSDWVQISVGLRLQSFFDHDFVFVTDPSDHLLYASLGRRSVDPNWFNSVQSELQPVLDAMRGGVDPGEGVVIDVTGLGTHRAALLQSFLGRPAIVGAVAVANGDEAAAEVDANAPVIVSVKLIDGDLLGEIASQLRLTNLRNVADRAAAPGDYVFDLTDKQGRSLARFAWTPRRPGAEILNSVTPFISIALGGFVLLAGLVLRHMRRTAATIAAGETRLRHLALHDPLCGLPNRIFFSERLETIIESVKDGAAPAAIFYIDLDHFKDVNDTLGHPIGDELIRCVTQRLTQTLRGDDLVARLGGDEFAVITSAGYDQATLETIGTRIIASLCSPYSIADQTIVIGASIGVAVINQHVGAVSDVMRHADMALYRAKNEGRNRACIYDTAMDDNILKRKVVENNLRATIEKGELQVAYQPIVNNSGETVVGVEALCRWRHPERGEIPPSEFIPIAEHSGLIIALGEWVLRQACLDGKAWPDITVSVNVSPLQFRRADFVDVVERILHETGFDATRLELEVTESTLLGNVDTAELAMFRLKALGVRLALDDFGTGYSSLLYLRRFPFDKLKIDRSFVHSIERAADAAAIVHAVVSLGRGLGMKVTAEGVETAEQQLFLRAAGVHMMQGYRFGRPGSAAEIDMRLSVPGSFTISDASSDLAMAG